MRILVVAGASGGHIFPALGLLAALKKKSGSLESLMVLPKCRKFCLGSSPGQQVFGNYAMRHISVSRISLRPDRENFFSVLGLIKALFESAFILLEFRPDIVVGFGSLASVPVVLLAWLFRVKTIIHEQNAIPGRATKFLAKLADKIAVSFGETRQYLRDCADKIALTGNPLREGLSKLDKNVALEFFGLEQDKFTVLVMGGSQASHRINIAFLEAASRLADKSRIQIIHLTGQADFGILEQGYGRLNLKARLFTFLPQMQFAYSCADLAISRAGATTIAELVFFSLPAILVPYPFAYEHQRANAGILAGRQAAEVINDRELNAEALARKLEFYIKNPDKIKKMRYNYSGMDSKDASDLLAQEVLSLI